MLIYSDSKRITDGFLNMFVERRASCDSKRKN